MNATDHFAFVENIEIIAIEEILHKLNSKGFSNPLRHLVVLIHISNVDE